MRFVFLVWAFDDAMIFEYFENVKISLSQEREELSKRNKKDFSLFHKCYPLDLQSKLAKLQRTQPLSKGNNTDMKWSNNLVSMFLTLINDLASSNIRPTG